MDKSVKYISMCYKAQDIQELRHPFNVKDGDVIFDTENNTYHFSNDEGWNFPKDIIGWLPRFDQLAEIVVSEENKMYDIQILLSGISFIARESSLLPNSGGYVKSLEMMLLEYVMKTAFHKQWNNGKEIWEAC